MKLRDNMLYQTSSPTLLNFYDQFSSVVFLGNSTPINRDDVPISKHISDFINNMKPAQRSSSTTTSSEWFIVLTEEEHLYYQQHQHLMTRPFTHHQQQRPRLHSDSVSAINYIIYVASTATTTSQSYLPNVPDDATLYLYSFILNPSSATSWQRYNRRAGYQELEPSTGSTISPTNDWGFLNMVVEGATAATLSFIRDSNFQQQHLIDYNLISSPTQCHVASIIAMIQHPAIRNRIRGWLNQYHHGIYSEFFNNNGDIRSKWLQQDPTTAGNIWSQPGSTMAAATFGQQDTTSAAASAQQATSAPAASASANQPASSTTTLASGTSITINTSSQAHHSSSSTRGTTTATTTTCRWTTSTAEQQQQQQDDVPDANLINSNDGERANRTSSCPTTTLRLCSSTPQPMVQRNISGGRDRQRQQLTT